MDEQAFNNYLSNVRANASAPVQDTQPVQQPVVQQPHHSGNWLTHLLPTGGAIGGGLGGAAAGAAIGSAVPILGTAVGGIAGGILGAAFGGGAGKATENATEGKGITNDVGTAAVEGGVGQALGGVAGKVLGKGAEFLANRAGTITKAAEQTASNAAVDKAALDAANATKNNFGGVKPGMQSANDLAGNQKLLQEWGLDHTSPEVMQNASKGGLFLNDIDNAALATGQPIKTTDLISSHDIASAAPEELAALTHPKVGIVGETGTIPLTVTPTQANAFAQNLNGEVRNLQGLMDNAHANGNVSEYNAAKQQLADLTAKYQNAQKLAATPEVNASIAARTISPDEKAQLVEQYGQTQADHLEKAVNEAQTHQDLVNAKLPFAQMNSISKQALNDMKATATPRALAREKMDTNGDGVADAVQPSLPETASGILQGGGGPLGVAGRAVAHSANNPQILNTLARMGELTAKVAPTAGVVAATAPNLAADPVGAGAGVPQQNDIMGASMQQQPENPLSQLYQTLLANYQAGGGITPNDAAIAPVLAQLAPAVQKQNLASTELSAIPGSFANAGGAQGTGGIMSHIAGLIPGTAAHTYQQQQQGAAQALAAQLGISPQAAMGLLPQLMQNQQGAAQNQGVLGQLTGQLAY